MTQFGVVRKRSWTSAILWWGMWWGIARMSLTESGLKALLPKEKKYRVSVGDALFVIVYPNGGN